MADFIALDGRAQLKFLLDELLTETKARFAPGVAGYEAILNSVGLGGNVNDNLRRAILEMAETRHVIVHRDGQSDANLLERCPWVPLWGIGKHLKVRRAEVGIFATALFAYVAELMVRLDAKGLLDTKQEVDWQNARVKNLADLNVRLQQPRPKPTGSETDWTLMAADLDKR